MTHLQTSHASLQMSHSSLQMSHANLHTSPIHVLERTSIIIDDHSHNWHRRRDLDESPRRSSLRKQAQVALENQAEVMKIRAGKKHCGPVIEVGTVVQVSAPDVDRARLDPPNATLVVVEQVQKPKSLMYRLACATGPINVLYQRSYINPVKSITAEMAGLQKALDGWQGMPQQGLRAAMAVQSITGGQGFVRCKCKGTCLSGKCKCRKAGRQCNSRCHRDNSKCCNKD